jgi:hypothetical protein
VRLLCSSDAPFRFLFSARRENLNRFGRAEEKRMERMIPVVDLVTGEVIDRTSRTLTLDLPPDFERTSAVVSLVVSLDQQSHGRYLATDGKEREYSVFPRPLSWRARGEDCLIAERRERVSDRTGLYRLMAVEAE